MTFTVSVIPVYSSSPVVVLTTSSAHEALARLRKLLALNGSAKCEMTGVIDAESLQALTAVQDRRM